MSRHLPRGKNNNSTDNIRISVKYDEWKMNRVIDVKSINPYNNCILENIIFLQYLSISKGLVDQMRLCFYRLRWEVFQNLILGPMNTGFVRPAVAIVLTVYGIETSPLGTRTRGKLVAIVLTVYGIETSSGMIFSVRHHTLQ